MVGFQKEGFLKSSTSQGRDQLPVQVAGKAQHRHKSQMFFSERKLKEILLMSLKFVYIQSPALFLASVSVLSPQPY